MKLWRASTIYEILEEFEIISSSDKTVTFLNHGRLTKEFKVNSSSSWHTLREDAKQYLIDKEKENIQKCLNSVKYYREKIKKLEQL